MKKKALLFFVVALFAAQTQAKVLAYEGETEDEFYYKDGLVCRYDEELDEEVCYYPIITPFGGELHWYD